MRIIRASEIGNYIYCQRAWWFQRQGHTPENQEALTSGIELHEQHGRSTSALGCLRSLAYVLIFAALIITIASLTARLIN